MIRHRISVILCCIVLCAGGALPARADLKAGMKAYQQKDYAAAMREFKADGKAQANYNISVMYYRGEGVQQDKNERQSGCVRPPSRDIPWQSSPWAPSILPVTVSSRTPPRG